MTFLVLLLKIIIIADALRGVHSKKGDNSNEVKLLLAINAGGPHHIDVHGIPYDKDPLTDGIASDHGMHLNQIGRAHPADEILYRTERYGTSTFGYDINLPEDGKYVLVMQFCEVYFREPGQKVFDVYLNGKHVIVADLDIFGTVGFAVAHQEIIPFEVKGGVSRLEVGEDVSKIRNKRIRLDFMKGQHDNPKINAFYVIKGSPDDVPPLPQMNYERNEGDDEEFYGDEEEFPEAFERQNDQKKYRKSGPSSYDPWEQESIWSSYGPIIISVGVGAVFILVLIKALRS
ncbi:unnamed protein product [Allacma fusca]|uniref:Malectin domain-containing protein n=1 Tax=Allacma fusca TaxID=39272 RepID=A0A8J2J2H6_9HEXA|nr:unnamed protein product [Allacma fusca]